MFGHAARIAFIGLLAAGCTAASDGEPASDAGPGTAGTETPAQVPPPKPVPVASSADILGEWDVVSFAGHAPDLRLSETNRAAFADFSEDGVGLRMECNWTGRAGHVDDGRWVPEEEDGIQTAMGCGEEGNAREGAYFGFFDGAPSVERVGPDRLRLVSGGTALVLERPEVRRLAFVPDAETLSGRWLVFGITHFLPEGGYAGSAFRDGPARVEIDGADIRLPDCNAAWRVTYSAEGELVPVDRNAVPDACAVLSDQRQGPQLPAASSFLKMLDGDILAERTTAGNIALFGGEYAVTLTRHCHIAEQKPDLKSWLGGCEEL